MSVRPPPAMLGVGDVIDIQTIGADDWFVGVTVTTADDDALTVQAKHKRPIGELGEHPFWIPWRAVAWIRLGTGTSTFTDPADDPAEPDDEEDEG